MNFSAKWLHRNLVLLSVCASAVCTYAQTGSPPAAPDQSWTASSDTAPPGNTNPSRTTESHRKVGNRTVDVKTVEVLGPDGRYQPYSEVETETIQKDATTTRSITRTYNPGAGGSRQLTQVTESETQKAGDGGTNVVRTISNVDGDGNQHVVERETTATTKGSGSENTQTTVYLPDVSGKLAPSMQIHEQKRGQPNADMETKKTTLLPDASGGWQVYEVREKTVKAEAKNQTTEERTSRRDFDGNIAPVSQVITKETHAKDQVTSTADTYSVDAPGAAREDRLRPIQRATTVEKKEPGRTITQQQVEEPFPGDPRADFGTETKTTDIVIVGGAGTEESKTLTVQYPDGYPSVVSVETRKSDQVTVVRAEDASSGNR